MSKLKIIILEDFSIILRTVLRQARIILDIIIFMEQSSEYRDGSFKCPTATAQDQGWHALVVERDQIEFLRELHFSWAKIARILGISKSTLC